MVDELYGHFLIMPVGDDCYHLRHNDHAMNLATGDDGKWHLFLCNSRGEETGFMAQGFDPIEDTAIALIRAFGAFVAHLCIKQGFNSAVAGPEAKRGGTQS